MLNMPGDTNIIYSNLGFLAIKSIVDKKHFMWYFHKEIKNYKGGKKIQLTEKAGKIGTIAIKKSRLLVAVIFVFFLINTVTHFF